MNIDDLKNAWNKDEGDEQLPDLICTTRKSNLPLAKMRRSMQAELIATVFAYATMFWVLFMNKQPVVIFNIICILLSILLALNIYYFLRFYGFYRSINKVDLTLKESVAQAAFDLQLNIELYRAYNICAAPLSVMLAFMLFCGRWMTPFLLKALDSAHNPRLFIWLLLTLVCSIIISYLFTEWNIKSKYGRALKHLKSVWSQLNTQA